MLDVDAVKVSSSESDLFRLCLSVRACVLWLLSPAASVLLPLSEAGSIYSVRLLINIATPPSVTLAVCTSGAVGSVATVVETTNW